MAKRNIITLPDPLLRKTSEPVERVDDEMRTLIDDMLETMYEAPGIGLAGIQIAVPRRVLVMDVSRDEDARAPHALINPEVVWTSDEMAPYEEGCLSIPEYYAEIERPARCRVTYIDRDGARQEMEADGILATCVHHEIDHLNGLLFIDYLSKLKRDRVIKKFAKAEKQRATHAL